MSDLRQSRMTFRLSQSELARIAGVPRIKICLHELGDRHLNPLEEKQVRDAIRREAARLGEAARQIR